MYLIKEITDLSIWEKSIKWTEYKIRKAARAIVKNEKWLIPLLYASKDNYYKLPWWWINEWENIIEWLEREFIEEVWAEIKIEWELWMTLEIKDQHKKIQFSYIYIWKIKNIIWEPKFTKKEIEDWLELHWMNVDDALNKIMNTKPTSYEGKMIRYRDLSIIEYYLQIVKSKHIV